jgi:hypothetical protein
MKSYIAEFSISNFFPEKGGLSFFTKHFHAISNLKNAQENDARGGAKKEGQGLG